MRRVLETIIRWLAEALVRLYYPHRSVEGAERLPREGPVVFVANHPNGLLDPLLVRVMTGRPARFLAKSTLFGNPLGRLAMAAFGSIPVYRAKEAGGKDASRNEESFARCRAALAEGEALLVAGTVSHNHLFFNRYAIDAALRVGDYANAERYAASLAKVGDRPMRYVDFLVRRAGALVARLRGQGDRAELTRLRDEALSRHWQAVLPVLEKALAPG